MGISYPHRHDPDTKLVEFGNVCTFDLSVILSIHLLGVVTRAGFFYLSTTIAINNTTARIHIGQKKNPPITQITTAT